MSNTFHVAVYVNDIPQAVEQYRKLLGIEPAKVRHDYAKFELADPPVIFSLNVGGEPGKLSHLGIRYADTGQVATEMVRAKRAEIPLLQQNATTCCYAKADKFWVRDADGIPWEMYALLETPRPRRRRMASCGRSSDRRAVRVCASVRRALLRVAACPTVCPRAAVRADSSMHSSTLVPFDNPAAWSGREMSKTTEWIYQLSEVERDDARRVADAARSAGVDVPSLDPGSVALGSLASAAGQMA